MPGINKRKSAKTTKSPEGTDYPKNFPKALDKFLAGGSFDELEGKLRSQDGRYVLIKLLGLGIENCFSLASRRCLAELDTALQSIVPRVLAGEKIEVHEWEPFNGAVMRMKLSAESHGPSRPSD